MFAIEEEEYIGEITYKQGLRVVIHPSDSPPFPAELGIDVMPGVSTSIGIRKVIHRGFLDEGSTSIYSELPPSYSNLPLYTCIIMNLYIF